MSDGRGVWGGRVSARATRVRVRAARPGRIMCRRVPFYKCTARAVSVTNSPLSTDWSARSGVRALMGVRVRL